MNSTVVSAQARHLDIRDLIARANDFSRGLTALKQKLGSQPFEWYPYDSIGSFAQLDRLLTGERRRLLDLAGEDSIVDIGCADGALSFFFESLGYQVHAIDHPLTNHNAMRGLRTLAQALDSRVTIHEIDIDRYFDLPTGNHGLVILLGALYHLKNPYQVLEILSRQSRYCLLSTRVARVLPDRTSPMHDAPVAYLVGEDELNDDYTNYWIFSEAGLRRLLRRTHWDVIDYLSVGDTEGSDPVHERHDERAYCLLRSRYGLTNVTLLEGWHAPEDRGWRWTEARFSADTLPAEAPRREVRLSFYLHPLLIERWPEVTLRAKAGGVDLEPATYRQPGDYSYVQRIPAAGPLEFSLDHALPASEFGRELGLIVAGIEFV